jgi:short-subunit dehydrogenase
LITGASSGIGLAITKQLAAEGVHLTLVARSVDRLKEIVTTLPGTDHQFLQFDLSVQNDIDELASHISGQNSWNRDNAANQPRGFLRWLN